MSEKLIKDFSFIIDGKIDEEKLEEAFNMILADAKKANKGNGAAGRRFRLNTISISKDFLDMRKVTPKK